MIFNSSSPLKKRNDGRYKLAAGDVINYEYEDSVHSAKVLSRSGKVTSETLKNRFNVESDGQSMSLNLEHVLCVEKMLEESIQICYEEDSFFTIVPDRIDPEIQLAEEAELESLTNFDTYEEVKDSNQKTMSCRWIITEKVKKDKKVFKARLVCRGF